MGASAWKVFPRAKGKIAETSGIRLDGTFRLSLHRTSADLTTRAAGLTVFTSVSWMSSGGGWGKSGAGTKANCDGLTLTTSWVTDAASGYKFDAANPVFTASASALSAVRYAVIWQSVAAASGHILCYAPLSTAQFDVQSSNTLTIQMNASGIFTLT